MTKKLDIQTAKEAVLELNFKMMSRKYLGVSNVYIFKCIKCKHKFRNPLNEILGGKKCAECSKVIRQSEEKVKINWKLQGEFIHAARTKLNMNQLELAAELGFSKAMVFNWETGNTQVSLKTINQLSNKLKVDRTELISAMTTDFKNHLMCFS